MCNRIIQKLKVKCPFLCVYDIEIYNLNIQNTYILREKKKESMSTVRSTKGSNLRSGYFSVLLEMLVTITVHMYYVLLNYFSEINTSLF